MSVGCPEPEPPRSLPCCGPGTAPGLGAGVPLLTEDMQALTLRTLAASDVTKHYELVRELGKGTYGKVDLVAYKGTGEHLGHRVANFEGQGGDLSGALGDSLQEPRSQQGDTVSGPGGEMQPEQPRET